MLNLNYTAYAVALTMLYNHFLCSVIHKFYQKAWSTLNVGTRCNVTAYRNAVPWRCGRDSWPRDVSKLGFAVTLRACLVRCRYLAVTSKGWYGYGLSRSGRATWHVTTVRSSHLLAPVTNSEPHGVPLAGYCYIMRHGVKGQIVTAYRVGPVVWVTGNVTALRYGVTLQCVPTVTVRGNVTVCTHLYGTR
jgi:hypothetical protein